MYIYKKWLEIKSYIKLSPFDPSSPEGRANERYRRLILTVLSSLATRGVGLAMAIITTPLTLSYLGVEKFGLWMTISSITTLLSFADFGIGSGLLNAVSHADGQNDRPAAQKAVSSAFFLLMLIAALIIVSFAVANIWLPWGFIFNLSQDTDVIEAKQAVSVLVICIALNLPLTTVLRVQMGFQEGFESNLWQALGNVITVVGVVWAALAEVSLPWLVLASSGFPILATLLNWMFQFVWQRRWLLPRPVHFDFVVGRNILRAGGIFATLQLIAFAGFYSDTFIISKILGTAAVAPYAIIYKLFSAIFVIQFAISALWPALNEAISRGAIIQARVMYYRATSICLGGGIIIAGFLVGLGRPVVALWIGPAIVPEWSLLIGFGAWTLVASYYATISALLSSSAFLSLQLRILGLAAVISFLLKILLVNIMGSSGAIWASVTGYGLVILYARIVARRALGNL